jgi:hypothetical protein
MEILNEKGNIWETSNDVSLYLIFGHSGMALNQNAPFNNLQEEFEQEQPRTLNGRTYFLINRDSATSEELRETMTDFLNYARLNNHTNLVTTGVNDSLQPHPVSLNTREHFRRQFERACQTKAMIKSWDLRYNTDNLVKSIRLRSLASDFIDFHC